MHMQIQVQIQMKMKMKMKTKTKTKVEMRKKTKRQIKILIQKKMKNTGTDQDTDAETLTVIHTDRKLKTKAKRRVTIGLLLLSCETFFVHLLMAPIAVPACLRARAAAARSCPGKMVPPLARPALVVATGREDVCRNRYGLSTGRHRRPQF